MRLVELEAYQKLNKPNVKWVQFIFRNNTIFDTKNLFLEKYLPKMEFFNIQLKKYFLLVDSLFSR